MEEKDKRSGRIHLFALIWGILITFLMLLAVGPKAIGSLFEDPSTFFSDVVNSFTEWVNPLAYFIVYLVGYIIIWGNKLWGSLIIIMASLFYVLMGGFDGPPIFAIPGFLVGILYLFDWYYSRQR
jgi:hypothetical protein